MLQPPFDRDRVVPFPNGVRASDHAYAVEPGKVPFDRGGRWKHRRRALAEHVFGGFLIFTGLKMLRAPDQQVDPERNALIRLFRRWIPVTRDLHGARFLVRVDGRWHATPLLVALVFLEMSDVIFAVDSVPAIFAISREPFIVFTSNVFAILGLRAMYFLLAGAIERFHLLKYGLAMVLVFVGAKMLIVDFYKIPVGLSLGIVGLIIATFMFASLWVTRKPAGGTPSQE